MQFLVLIGRIFFSLIFILSSIKHFSSSQIEYAAGHGVPIPSLLVPLSGVVALLGGLSILLGYHAKIGAWLLVIFLIPVTIMMHHFWDIADPNAAQIQQIMFLKNLSMLGAAFLLTYFGSGPFSIDRIKETKQHLNE